MKQDHAFILKMIETVGMILLMCGIVYCIFFVPVTELNGKVVYFFVGTFVGVFSSFILGSKREE